MYAALSLVLSIGCKSAQRDGSETKVAGGQATQAGEYENVIRFLVDVKSGRFCTGVVVSETTALLAGHCIKDSTLSHKIFAQRPAYMKPGQPIQSDKIYFWGAVGGLELLNDDSIKRDLAVVAFKKSSEPDGFQGFRGPFAKLSSQTLAGQGYQGKDVTVVGFGASELGDSDVARDSLGIKRAGTNVIASYTGYYRLKRVLADKDSKTSAVAAAGDAGAPLFNKSGQLIGLGAGLMLTKSKDSAAGEGPKQVPTELTTDSLGYPMHALADAEQAHNAFVDLGSAESQKLLAYAVWKGKADGVPVSIDGIDPTAEPDMSDEDYSWMLPNHKDRSGSWIAMTGGGGIAEDGLALAEITTYGGCTMRQDASGNVVTTGDCGSSAGGSQMLDPFAGGGASGFADAFAIPPPQDVEPFNPQSLASFNPGGFSGGAFPSGPSGGTFPSGPSGGTFPSGPSGGTFPSGPSGGTFPSGPSGGTFPSGPSGGTFPSFPGAATPPNLSDFPSFGGPTFPQHNFPPPSDPRWKRLDTSKGCVTVGSVTACP
jgi:hypothetical protein